MASALRALIESLEESSNNLAQAIINANTVGLIGNEAFTEIAQLQTALDARVIVEQAKGMLAQRCDITPDEAWARLRHFSRTNNRRANEVARELVARTLPPADVAALVEER